MAYIPYPQAPPTQNGYQILGQGLLDFGQGLSAEEERQMKLREAMDQMTQRRAAALLAKQESELRQKALEQETRLKSEADSRAHDFALAVAQGKIISPTLAKDPSLAQPTRRPAAPPMRASAPDAAGELPAQSVQGDDATAMLGRALDNYQAENPPEPLPLTRDEVTQKALEMRQLTADQYLDDTKPVRGRYSIQEIGNRKVKVDLDTGEQIDLGPAKPQRDRFTVNEVNGRKVRVNLDTGEMQDLGPITEKKISPKDQATAKNKITMLTLAKQQLDQVQKKFDAIKGTFSAGPAGQGKAPTPSGKAFDAAVDAIRGTMSGLTRVPGVGAMSDFETKLSQAPIPNRNNYEDVTQQQIDQWYQLINTLAEGYQGMLPGVEDAPPDGADGGTPPPAPTATGTNPRAAGPTIPARGRFRALDAKTAGEYLRKAGGDRKKARAMLAKDGYNVGG